MGRTWSTSFNYITKLEVSVFMARTWSTSFNYITKLKVSVFMGRDVKLSSK